MGKSFQKEKRLQEERLRRHWRQADVAEQLGTTELTVRRWEQGRQRPGAYYRLKLCMLFGKSAEELGLVEAEAHLSPSAGKQEAKVERPPSPPGEDLALWTVPYHRNPHFTGREDLLEQLDHHFSSGKSGDPTAPRRAALTQPQAIKGLGGIGKTQIAVEYAYRAREQGYYTHTFWINAASSEAILSSFMALAELLHDCVAKEEKDQRKLASAIKRWLEQCQESWLLVFDNADDLSLVQEYLPQHGNGGVLLTTRVSAVGSLAASLEVENMGLVEGTLLLLSRAQRLDASDEMRNEAMNIVVALDGFPLALDQAGAYIEETGCCFADYLRLYQDHHQMLLARRGKQATSYPDSVATTWSLSFQSVEQANPAAAELLRLCAFLAPDHIPEELFKEGIVYWPPALQHAVSDLFAFNQMLEILRTFSLVKRLQDEQALSIHRLVQAVQLDVIRPEEQRQWAKRVVCVVNALFPRHPKEEVASWPQCLRYLEQVQACATLIQAYSLYLSEAVELLDRAGLYLHEQSSYLLAKPLFQQALFLWEQLEGPDLHQKALLLSHLARLAARQGEPEQAEHLGMRALSLYEGLGWSEHPALACLLNDLGGIYHNQGNSEQAKRSYRRALALSEHHPESTGLEMARSLDELAGLAHLLGRYEQAEAWYQRALLLYERQLGPSHPRVGTTLNNFGNLYVYMEKYEQAAPLLERALAIRQECLGDTHDDVASTLAILGNLFHAQHKDEQAEHCHQKALAIRELRLGARHPYTSATLNNLAELAQERGDYPRAEHLYQQTLLIREEQLGPEHMETAYPLYGLATLRLQQGQIAEAEAFALRALAIREQTLPPVHPELGKTLAVLAAIREAQGQLQEAVSLYQRALAIRERALGAHHPRTAETRTAHAALLQCIARDQQGDECVSFAQNSQPERAGNDAEADGERRGGVLVMPPCPHCHNNTAVSKHGTNRSGTQRFRCRLCSCSFTAHLHQRGYDPSFKEQAIALKAQGHSNRSIARVLGVDHHTVRNWIQTIQAEQASEQEDGG